MLLQEYRWQSCPQLLNLSAERPRRPPSSASWYKGMPQRQLWFLEQVPFRSHKICPEIKAKGFSFWLSRYLGQYATNHSKKILNVFHKNSPEFCKFESNTTSSFSLSEVILLLNIEYVE